MKTFSTKPSVEEKTKEIECPLCSSSEYVKTWHLEDYSFSKCPSCNLVYQNPQPVQEDVEKRYDNSYFEYEIENEKIFLDLMLLGLKDAGFNPESVGAESKRVLDIGCATGLFLSFMKKRGWETYGVEICQSAAEYGNSKRGVNIFTGTLDKAEYPDSFFDVIHLSHVIEHINDPDLFIAAIYRLLKPGGVIYCTTPNVDGLQAKLFKRNWRSAIADHMILYSVKTLKRILRKYGFTIKKHKTWGGLCAGSGYPDFIKKILDRLAKPLGFGDVVIVCAEKQA